MLQNLFIIFAELLNWVHEHGLRTMAPWHLEANGHLAKDIKMEWQPSL